MTLMHLFLIYRYKAASIHYLTPTDDNHRQAESMERLGLFRSTSDEIGEIIVADVDGDIIKSLVEPASDARKRLIAKV
jgi:isocitrate lyase